MNLYIYIKFYYYYFFLKKKKKKFIMSNSDSESANSEFLEEEEIEELEEDESNNLNIMYYCPNDEGSSCGYCKGEKSSFTYGNKEILHYSIKNIERKKNNRIYIINIILICYLIIY